MTLGVGLKTKLVERKSLENEFIYIYILNKS